MSGSRRTRPSPVAPASAGVPPSPAPPRRSATSTQVARAAGVSRTTVSFVLNNVVDQGISASTRAKVLRIAEELGYQPNAAARSLASGSTGTVALVIPRAEHLYYDQFLAQLLASINDECHALGLKLLVESAEHDSREASGFVKLVRTRRIDGLIVANPRRDQAEHLRAMAAADIPLVVLAPPLPGDLATLCALSQDTRAAAREAVTHLLALGHREIACVGFAGSVYFAGSERELGWRDALESAGVAATGDLLEVANLTSESAYLATRRLLASGRRFTALFAGNDTIAFGAMAALREAGRDIPRDVSLVGYDDIPLARFAHPPLTTVRSDPIAHGRVAMARLAQQLGAGDGATAELPPPALVCRASSGPPG